MTSAGPPPESLGSDSAGRSDRVSATDGRWGALAWLGLATLLAMSTWLSGTAVLGPLREEWRLGASATAWLTISVQLGFVLGSLVAAVLNLLDVIPVRRVLLISMLATGAVNAGFAAVHDVSSGMALRFATGFFLAGVYPPSLKLMATWFVRDRGRALGIMVGALSVGSAMPYLVNAFGGMPWRSVVLLTSAQTLVGVVIVAAAVREGPFPFPRARFDPSQVGSIFRNRGVWLACVGYFGHMWELYAMWAWFFVFLWQSLERAGAAHPRTVASLGAFAVIASGFLGSWWAGILSDRWGRTRTTALSMALSGACALSIGFLFGASPFLVVTLGLVWGITVVADSAQFSTMVTELADPAYVGTALTLQLGIGFTLTTLTIWLMPLLHESLGWRWAFVFLVPGPLVGIAAMLRLLRLPEARRLAGGRG